VEIAFVSTREGKNGLGVEWAVHGENGTRLDIKALVFAILVCDEDRRT
jgi:hypothetical protein